MNVFDFSVSFSKTCLILGRIQQDTTIIYVDLHVLYSLFLLSFKETWFFLTSLKNIQKWNFMKLLLMVTELFNLEGRTDMTMSIVGIAILRKCSKLKYY